jgi:hypothetical protein
MVQMPDYPLPFPPGTSINDIPFVVPGQKKVAHLLWLEHKVFDIKWVLDESGEKGVATAYGKCDCPAEPLFPYDVSEVVIKVALPPISFLALLKKYFSRPDITAIIGGGDTLAIPGYDFRLSWLVYAPASHIGRTIQPSGKGEELDVSFDKDNSRIQVCSAISDEFLKKLAKFPEQRFQIDPRMFEETVAELLNRMGYQVILTPRSGDHGRDVIASIGTNVAPLLILVECKRYSPALFVGPEPIARLWLRMSVDNANLGVVITTSGFKPVARKVALLKGYQLSLKDGLDFIAWVRKAVGYPEEAK